MKCNYIGSKKSVENDTVMIKINLKRGLKSFKISNFFDR